MSDNPTGDCDRFLDAIAYAYSRQQALEDGVLVDAMQTPLGDLSRQRTRWPIAMTAGVWDALQAMTDGDRPGVWSDLLLASEATGQPTTPSVRLVTVTINGVGRWQFKLASGPDDDGQPCLTVMLPDED